MKLIAAAASLALLACASGGAGKARLLEPDIFIVQLSGPAEQNYPAGKMEVQYSLHVGNRSSEPITLRRVELQQTGTGGPYRLESASYYFNKVIAPGEFEEIPFWARATATGNAFAIDAQAPVTLRGAAYFDAESGKFRHVFTKMLNQMGGSSPH